jgi:hypothetical protein
VVLPRYEGFSADSRDLHQKLSIGAKFWKKGAEYTQPLNYQLKVDSSAGAALGCACRFTDFVAVAATV